MTERWTALFAYGDGVLVTSGSYDSAQEAADAAAAEQTDDVRLVLPIRHLGPRDMRVLTAQEALRRHTESMEPAGTTAEARASLGRRMGVVVRWDPGCTYGFLVDTGGQTWFLGDRDLPEGYTSLDVDTIVTFVGSPHPMPGKRYPQARSLRIEPA